MEKILIAIISGFFIWFIAKTVMKNDFKKNINFFIFSKKIKDEDTKIMSYIFSFISILIPIIVFLTLSK